MRQARRVMGRRYHKIVNNKSYIKSIYAFLYKSWFILENGDVENNISLAVGTMHTVKLRPIQLPLASPCGWISHRSAIGQNWPNYKSVLHGDLCVYWPINVLPENCIQAIYQLYLDFIYSALSVCDLQIIILHLMAMA